MFENETIGFVGGGNMGEALIRGLLSASLFTKERIFVFDASPSRMEYLAGEYGINACRNIAELAASVGIVLIAVKPQVASHVLDELRSHISRKALLISIAAGIPLDLIERYMPEGTAVVRVMPNTPALVQKGASALSKGKSVTAEQMEMSLALFRAVGKAVEVEEKMMDAVTGLSGSGPGYILLVIEALIDAGVLVGLTRQTARELVVQTVLGTASMLDQTKKHPAELKDMITSPAGTTIEGLMAMERKGVRAALMEAVLVATGRSAELGKG